MNGGSSVASITQKEGTSVAKPKDPLKDNSSFEGWFYESSLITEVSWPFTLSSDTTLYAKWEEEVIQTYTIIWKNWDGTVLETDSDVIYGQIPQYDGAQPTKQSVVSVMHYFNGWSPQISAVTKDAEYTAVFTNEPVTFTIIWKDGDVVLGSTKVLYGVLPSYSLPTDTEEWKYSWSPAITAATKDTFYTLVKTKQTYTITFYSNDGSSVASITDNYGTSVSKPKDPTRDGYKFVSWCTDLELENMITWPITLNKDYTLYAAWNEKVEYDTYLQSLFSTYTVNPYAFIPDAMLPGANLVDESAASLDFSNFVNISGIPYGGHGEQWNMVLANLSQSQIFFNVLTVIDTLSATSITAFNNYLDSNPVDTANYSFKSGIYSVTIHFENNTIFYVLDYTGTIPLIGEQSIQISLSYNIDTHKKVGRIQLGDANALKYEVTDNSYKFAVKYAGIRRAIFEIEKNGYETEGRIFEYLGHDNVFSFSSVAQFFINNDYVSVVGNKSSGMIGWSGTINELYSAREGNLLGYEVRETLSSVTYNTLWFNLDDTTGISSIKRESAPLENANPDLIYVNGSSEVFTAKKVGGLNLKMASRRYDIEFRTQYFYYHNGEEIVGISVDVPMLFVQEEQLNSLATDITSSNAGIVTSFTLDTLTKDKDKIMNDYNTLIDSFIVQKNEYSVQNILDFIGEAYSFMPI